MKLKFVKLAAGAVAWAAAAVIFPTFALAAELPEELAPVGEAVGIAVRTDGVMVSELSEFRGEGGSISPARDAGLLPGDVIIAIDGVSVDSAAEMSELVEAAGDTVTVGYTRGGEERRTVLRPYSEDGERYLGVWVRDSLTGIGTVTYFDPATGEFGALGHSIADSATGADVPLREGTILDASVTGITKSRSGSPGQLGGSFDRSRVLGTIDLNCGCGIFGTAPDGFDGCGLLPVAGADEVKPGQAKIISDASGEKREYAVEITRVYRGGDSGRDMMLKVTDPELLELTGGIVQGMSGSPIIQNGKLVGAVTHVLINDPKKGYGVFVENMIASQKKA